jgi:hypothetical protein
VVCSVCHSGTHSVCACLSFRGRETGTAERVSPLDGWMRAAVPESQSVLGTACGIGLSLILWSDDCWVHVLDALVWQQQYGVACLAQRVSSWHGTFRPLLPACCLAPQQLNSCMVLGEQFLLVFADSTSILADSTLAQVTVTVPLSVRDKS